MWERVSIWGIRSRLWFGRIVRRFLRPGNVIVAGVDAIYAICQILQEEAIPSASAWTLHDPLGWLLASSAGVGLLGTLVVFTGFDRVLRRVGQDDDLEEACKGLWRLMVEQFVVPMECVAVHVWEVRGFRGFRHLRRRASFMIKGRPNRPHVIWTMGKGAVGLAWAEDDVVVADVAQLRQHAPEEAAFAAISLRERFGLSWREFRHSSQHLDGVLAAPIRTGGRVSAVLSVDVRDAAYLQALATLATSDDLWNVLRFCETVFEGGN